MEIKKILVTGGAGFIGSHVVDELISAGYEVRILDNLGAPTHDGTLPAWVNTQAEFVQGDVRNREDWKKALVGVDAVIHLAAYMDFHLDFSTYSDTNTKSVALLFELIVEEKLPIKKIIAASSQSVYGEGKYRCGEHGEGYYNLRSEEQLKKHEWEQHCPICNKTVEPVAEKEDDALHSEIPYAISKQASEQLLLKLGKMYKVPTVSLRYSIVLGPRQSFRHFYSGALRSFAVNALNHEPIQMNEDGMQLRDFVHVKDVATAHRMALENNEADFGIFNVGSGEATRVIDLAKIVVEEAGVSCEPLLTNRYRAGGTRHSIMDISKLKNIGWKPTHTLREMVHDYMEWIRQFENLANILKKTEEEMRSKGLLKQM